MILTLYYMYATVLQWWRLGALKNKINGTLGGQNALLVATGNVISDNQNRRCLENLLFHNENRIGCTVIPKQTINLSQFAQFPKNYKYFPLHINDVNLRLENPKLNLLVSARLESYAPHESDLVQIENYGKLLGWKASDDFHVVLETDLTNLTKLVYYFSTHNIDINHEMQLLKIETVEIEGYPVKIKYDTKVENDQNLKFSHAPIHWKQFVQNVKALYAKLLDSTATPKITIENGCKVEDNKKVPVSEVKPIKKESKKTQEKSENRLVVDSGKHKSKSPHRTGHEPKTSSPNRNDESKSSSKVKALKVVGKDEHKSRDRAQEKRNVYKQSSGDRKTETTAGTSSTDVVDFKAETNATPSKLYSDTLKCPNKAKERDGKKINSSKDPNGHLLTVAKTSNYGASTHSTAGGKESATSSQLKNVKEMKPPNVLVYADSLVGKENVKNVLNTILNRDKYTVYDLPTNSSNCLWDGSTTLVVVCGTVTEDIMKKLLEYLVSGGQLLCLCSDLLHSVLNTFATAEVREHELVRFSYGEWKRVKMMHHIFCYQASPAKKQFSKDSDQSHSSNSSSPVAPRTPSIVDIQHSGKSYTIQVQVLGTEETWETPSLLLACVKNTSGRAIFSQVHLEIDPTEYQDDENKYAALKDSNKARLEILKDILSKHLDMDCNNVQDATYTPAYFLGRHDSKLKMLSECVDIQEGKLELEKCTLNFIGKDVEAGIACYNKLPVYIHSCPSNFSTVQFYEALQTEEIGRLVIYADVLASSQFILNKKLQHGLVVLPRQQTQAVGRSNNSWLSPVGCAMFSLQLHIPVDSIFGGSLPLIQHFVMVSVVHAIKKKPGYQDIEIGIKWPNDLYAYSSVKIGGLVINSFLEPETAVVNIGCGINLNNSNPTTCINNVIRRHNDQNKTNLSVLPYETFFAQIFNEIEQLYKMVQAGQIDYLFTLYYKYWLHSNAEITVNTKDGQSRQVTVTGVDEFGYLKVRSKDGTASSVQPDGNSFDMLKGLIAPKIF